MAGVVIEVPVGWVLGGLAVGAFQLLIAMLMSRFVFKEPGWICGKWLAVLTYGLLLDGLLAWASLLGLEDLRWSWAACAALEFMMVAVPIVTYATAWQLSRGDPPEQANPP